MKQQRTLIVLAGGRHRGRRRGVWRLLRYPEYARQRSRGRQYPGGRCVRTDSGWHAADDGPIACGRWPARNPVPGAFSDPKQAIDRGVISTIAENEPITAFKVAGPESGSGLPPVIPEGMRAMSIRVNEIVGVAGFVMPGTHVDIVLSVSNPGQLMARSRWPARSSATSWS